ncbi:ubiquitin-specific protease doa4 [Coemansia sp. Benny D115]|nr:ubiquitin-specific protease doa4 [Coemansia sp. Benny D115]
MSRVSDGSRIAELRRKLNGLGPGNGGLGDALQDTSAAPSPPVLAKRTHHVSDNIRRQQEFLRQSFAGANSSTSPLPAKLTAFPELENTPPMHPTSASTSATDAISIHRPERTRPKDIAAPVSAAAAAAAAAATTSLSPVATAANGGLSVSPLPGASSLPPPKFSTSSSSPAMGSYLDASALTQVDASPVSGPTARRKSLITVLNQKATLNPDIKVAAKVWLTSAQRCLDEARLSRASGDMESAYIKYTLVSKILFDKLPRLNDFSTVNTSTVYLKLKTEFASRVINELEQVADVVRKIPYIDASDNSAPKTPTDPLEQMNRLESRFTQMYPDSSFITSPAMPAFESPPQNPVPGSGSLGHSGDASSLSSTPGAQWMAAHQSRFEEIDAKVRMIDAQARMIDTPQTTSSSAATVPGVSIISHSNRRVAMALSPQLESIGEDAGTESTGLGTSTTCTVDELRMMLDRSDKSANGRPTVLLLDVRPEQEYVWGHIDHRYVVNIDPTVLQNTHCSLADITSSLVLVPDEQQKWFQRRSQFDVIVYVSQSARSFGDHGNKEVAALEKLNSIIYHCEYENPLKQPPLFLIGGFDAWAKGMGNRRCRWSENAQNSIQRSSRPKSIHHWGSPDAGNSNGKYIADSQTGSSFPGSSVAASTSGVPAVPAVPAVDLSAMLSYHAPNGALFGRNSASYQMGYQSVPAVPPVPPLPPVSQAPAWTESNNQSAVMSPVSGSVYDFFQQNSGYYPQWNQQGSRDGRYLPVHSSHTQGLSTLTSPVATQQAAVDANVTSGGSGGGGGGQVMVDSGNYQDSYLPISSTISDTGAYGDVAATSNYQATDQPQQSLPQQHQHQQQQQQLLQQHLPLRPQALMQESQQTEPVDDNSIEIRRRKSIFDNPTYGFTAPGYDGPVADKEPDQPVAPDALDAPDNSAVVETVADEREEYHVPLRKRRPPPPIPNALLPPKPEAYVQQQRNKQHQQPWHHRQQQQQHNQQEQQQQQTGSLGSAPSIPLPPKPIAYTNTQPVVVKPLHVAPQYQHMQMAPPYQQVPPPQHYQIAPQYQQVPHYPQGLPHQQVPQYQHYTQPHQYQYQHPSQGFYSHPVAAGSDPSLNGRMHMAGNLRNPAIYGQVGDAFGGNTPTPNKATAVAAVAAAASASKRTARRSSHTAWESESYGATGLKNFGNTCFMNCVIQCLVGTVPFARYFMRGMWKKDLVRDPKQSNADIAAEFAGLVDSMWRGQYSFLSPSAFRSAVGRKSIQFKGSDQEDAQEFASFLLDALHEALNRMHPRPPPERDLTIEEEQQVERQPDIAQASFYWSRYIRRNWSIMTSVFQGQIQSRLTCMTCKATSTTYYTFTELSVPIPSGTSSTGKLSGATALLRKSTGRNNSGQPVSLYQCLEAFAENEVLDGDNRWHCPKCRTKRRATKRLLVSRLPLVLIVHLKRFSTIGHFREKLETNVVFPTQQLEMSRYAIPGIEMY